ncbi:hypothetical protein R1sor_021462 [Riccia sorocarpa]|uniref:Uncharacterized protein n=1 Tax=Riccia sorocarpa TaxID=122646 RepID=A0ABD3GKV0_9MARC
MKVKLAGTSSVKTKKEVLQLNLSVLWSRKSKSVLYLECGKDFLDILLSLLITPLGAVLKLLEEEGLLSDIKNGQFVMYASLRRLDKALLCVKKDVLLDPQPVLSSSQNFVLLQKPVEYTCVRPNCSNRTNSRRELCCECAVVVVYRCPLCGKKETANSSCSSCSVPGGSVTKTHYEIESRPQPYPLMKANAAKSLKKGYARKNITYMLKDDLSVSKCGTMSTVALLQSMKVESFQDLETREIVVDRHKILLLVRAALVSTTPLTDVFGPMFGRNGTLLFTKSDTEDPVKLCVGDQPDNFETKENTSNPNVVQQSGDEKASTDSGFSSRSFPWSTFPRVGSLFDNPNLVQQSSDEKASTDSCFSSGSFPRSSFPRAGSLFGNPIVVQQSSDEKASTDSGFSLGSFPRSSFDRADSPFLSDRSPSTT